MGRVVARATLISSIVAAAGALSAAPAAEAPVAIVAEYDGIIHPIAAEYFDEVIARRNVGRTVAVVVLRTPGGLLDSTRTIVSRMVAARTPVVIFVGPSARAPLPPASSSPSPPTLRQWRRGHTSAPRIQSRHGRTARKRHGTTKAARMPPPMRERLLRRAGATRSWRRGRPRKSRRSLNAKRCRPRRR